MLGCCRGECGKSELGFQRRKREKRKGGERLFNLFCSEKEDSGKGFRRSYRESGWVGSPLE